MINLMSKISAWQLSSVIKRYLRWFYTTTLLLGVSILME